MIGWLDNLSGASFMFAVIGVVAGGLLLLQIVLLLFGFGVDSDVDVGADGDDSWSSGLLSVRGLIAFFFAFGWTGLIVDGSGAGVPLSVAAAAAGGGSLFVGVGLLWRQFSKLDESGNIDYASAVGAVATVYLLVPENRSGAGKVEVAVQGRMRVVDAFTEAESSIVSGSRAEIVAVIDDHTVLVAPA